MKNPGIWTPANILSLARIGAAPIVLLILYLELYINGAKSPELLDQIQNPWITLIAFFFFLFASLSDMFDGYLARKRNEVTTLGKFLDPLADKILVTTVLIMLVKFDWAPAWLVVFIIIREVAITAMRSIASSEGKVIPAGPWGKIKTVVQLVALHFLLIHYSYFGIPFHFIGTILLYAAFVLTIYSGLDYMNKYFSQRETPKREIGEN